MKQFSGRNSRLNNKAFTLIEVLISISVIVVLVALASYTATSYVKTSRDSSRESKASVIANALEKYYDKNNEYPSVAFMTSPDADVVRQKLNIADKTILQFPLANESVANSIVATSPTTTSVLAYTATTVDVAARAQCQSNTNGYCDAFELRYVKEADGSTVVIKSQNNDVAVIEPETPPAAPTVSATYVSSSSLRFNVGGTHCGANNIEYKIRYNTSSASTSSMPNWDTISWSSSNTRTINPGTFVNFYIQAIARCVKSISDVSPASQPSAVVTFVKPTPPAAPSVSASAISTSSTSIILSWTNSAGATSYVVTGPGTAANCTSSPCTVTGLSGNTPYVFYVRAQNNAGASAAGSATVTTTAAPAVPARITSINVTSSTDTTTTWNWNHVGCNVGQPEYYVQLYTHGYGTWSSAIYTSATTMTLNTSTKGAYYELIGFARCKNGSETSGWNAQTSAGSWLRPLDAPQVWASATGPTTATVFWDSPAYATSYRVTRSGMATSCTSSPCDITGLSSSSTYTFHVYATNDHTGVSSVGHWSITTPALPTTPAKVSSVWVSDTSSTQTRWNWSSVTCNVGSPRYYVQMYTHHYGVYSPVVYTTNTTIVLDTATQGAYYELMVFAQCVSGSASSGWSAQTSAPLWLREISNWIMVRNGYTKIIHDDTNTAPNSMWGESGVTQVLNSCPSGSSARYSTQVQIDQSNYKAFGSYNSNTVAYWRSALWQGAMFETMWHARCDNTTTGVVGTSTYSDLFGNAHVNETRSQSQNKRGRWSRGCDGNLPVAYDNVCTAQPMTYLPGW